MNPQQTHIKARLESILVEHLHLDDVTVDIEIPNDSSHGDYATNVAMKLAKVLKKNPLAIAQEILTHLTPDEVIAEASVARPGFINIRLTNDTLYDVLTAVLQQEGQFGAQPSQNQRVLIEFVSVNPTGAMHIGHARGAAAGDSLARLMRKAGYDVTTEFYVNDAGNQIDNLGLSLKARVLEHLSFPFTLPEDGYYGPEIKTLALKLIETHGETVKDQSLEFFKNHGVEALMKGIQEDLKAFGVEFDRYFSEKSLYDTNAVETTLQTLKNKGYTYREDDALWLKTSQFGDEKDRVLIKQDGSYTYITPDIAYHHDKIKRGYDLLIDILGGDHHGYVSRLKAAIAMLGEQSALLEVDLLQMVRVIQDGVEVKMSKRSGKALSLRDLIEEVGVDPIRYFFGMRSLNTHMDLDLDLALKQSNENPVYYVQYAHARIQRLLEKARRDKGLTPQKDLQTYTTLHGEKIETLLKALALYPETIARSAQTRMVHKIPQYAHKLATALHSVYSDDAILTDDAVHVVERLNLLKATQIILKDALYLIGVNAKDTM